MNETGKTLAEVVARRPYPDYADWWPLGADFVHFMAKAIVSQWRGLLGNEDKLDTVTAYTRHYLDVVYGRPMRPGLVGAFASQHVAETMESGEFDALSYAFFRAAFERIAAQPAAYASPLSEERRLFTKRVGRAFYSQVHDRLDLALPPALQSDADLVQLQVGIGQVGDFLMTQGYLRDHFAFRFDVTIVHNDRQIEQSVADVLPDLAQHGVAHALYEMGYPVILPSAVYLFHTVGEAQHHSSRTIEELFARVGCDARETDDFDPIGYPSDMVVELWEIRRS